MTTALGVSVDENDNGVTPLTHRMIIGSFFQNKGVVDGLEVTGRSDLKYAVAAGVAVCSRAASDGKMLAYWPGGTTETAVSAGDPSNPRVDVIWIHAVAAGVAVCSRAASDGKMLAYWPGGTTETAVSAGDPSNPRVDVIWIQANNKPDYVNDPDNQVHVGVTQGVPSANPVKPVIPAAATPRVDVIWIQANNKPDYVNDPDNQVHVGVTQGVPSANPVKPVIPAAATEICCMRMPAGATSTSAASMIWTVPYALPYGSTLGVIAENWDRRNFSWTANKGVIVREQKVTFTLPTDRLLRFCYKCNFSAQGANKDSVSEWVMQFYVDGTPLDHSATNMVSHNTSWTTHETSYISAVAAGTHTAEIGGWFGYGSKPNFHYNDANGDQNSTWTGRTHETSYISAVAAGTHTAEIGGWFGYGSKPNFHYNDANGDQNSTWTGRRFLIVDVGAAI